MAIIKQAPKYRYINGMSELVGPTKDGMGVQVEAQWAELLTGDSKGELVQDIKPNQLARISCEVGPRKFNAMAGYNPALAEVADVSMNPILEDGDTMELVIKARKAFNITDFPYIFKMWVTE